MNHTLLQALILVCSLVCSLALALTAWIILALLLRKFLDHRQAWACVARVRQVLGGNNRSPVSIRDALAQIDWPYTPAIGPAARPDGSLDLERLGETWRQMLEDFKFVRRDRDWYLAAAGLVANLNGFLAMLLAWAASFHDIGLQGLVTATTGGIPVLLKLGTGIGGAIIGVFQFLLTILATRGMYGDRLSRAEKSALECAFRTLRDLAADPTALKQPPVASTSHQQETPGLTADADVLRGFVFIRRIGIWLGQEGSLGEEAFNSLVAVASLRRNKQQQHAAPPPVPVVAVSHAPPRQPQVVLGQGLRPSGKSNGGGI